MRKDEIPWTLKYRDAHQVQRVIIGARDFEHATEVGQKYVETLSSDRPGHKHRYVGVEKFYVADGSILEEEEKPVTRESGPEETKPGLAAKVAEAIRG